mmetsp:Transcript_27563/g.79863  ORF Transcript_27563/g.79863 Transcript_27563/m.79863 type:complete len:240 (-) Transcript_27563:733-1452(-)
MASSMRTTKTARAKVYNCLNGDALGVRICALVRANMQCAMRHGNNLVNDKVNSGNEPRSKYLFRPMRKLYVLVVPQMQYTWRKKAPFQENVARASTTSPPLANVASLAGSPRELRTDMNVKPNCSSFHMKSCTEEETTYSAEPQPKREFSVAPSIHAKMDPTKNMPPPARLSSAPHQALVSASVVKTWFWKHSKTPPNANRKAPTTKDHLMIPSASAGGRNGGTSSKIMPTVKLRTPEK